MRNDHLKLMQILFVIFISDPLIIHTISLLREAAFQLKKSFI